MINQLLDWQGNIEIGGQQYIADQLSTINFKTFSDDMHILLHSKSKNVIQSATERQTVEPVDENTEYMIKVKAYMTKPASPEFDFMSKWNNNEPMPMRVMVGTKDKETKGMVHMTLHGDILQKITPVCMKCGRPITNPVSQFFGMGPECGGHNYVNPFDSEEELNSAVESYRIKLQNMKWSGWIIKSAIEQEMPVVKK